MVTRTSIRFSPMEPTLFRRRSLRLSRWSAHFVMRRKKREVTAKLAIARERLQAAAQTDHLTQLLNLRGLESMLGRVMLEVAGVEERHLRDSSRSG